MTARITLQYLASGASMLRSRKITMLTSTQHLVVGLTFSRGKEKEQNESGIRVILPREGRQLTSLRAKGFEGETSKRSQTFEHTQPLSQKASGEAPDQVPNLIKVPLVLLGHILGQ